MIEVGQQAPDFASVDQDGKERNLSDFSREVCKQYGTLRKEGFSERAYFIIDKSGIVRFKYFMATPGERIENEQLIEELNKL